METKTISEINEYEGTSVNPLETPDELFELYSVPSYDNQYPEIIKGSAIGSTKITVQENDVLICKINPRINRVWIVKHNTSHRLLASSEWIVVRNSTINPRYLQWYFSSPAFRDKITSQVAGIGGSLTRAQPKVVVNYSVPIPPIQKQNEVANSLDLLEQLISLRKKQLQKLDDLVKARFVEMFGEHGKQVPLSDFVWFQEGPGVRSVDFTNEGVILLTGSNINDNEITFGHKSDRFISRALADGRYSHFMCDIDDILVVSSAIDPEKFDKKVTIVREDKKYCLNTGIIRFKPDRKVMTLSYFREFLKTDYFKHQVMEEMRGIAQMHFGPTHLKRMTILLPDSIEQQESFENFISQVDKSKLSFQQSLEKLEILKQSLMQQYFG